MSFENFDNSQLMNVQDNAGFDGDGKKIIHLSGMYQEWFLDYASYVILERAVPHISDGLKPVQRRILHSMKKLDDGRYNKVANIIGHTMQFHPHGDASIGDALVQLGQRDLLIDCQGNWGNIMTGDDAAAPRYIEARLSKFALDILFNPKTTHWKPTYDGRNNEPVTLPAKFPVLLAHGAEGIAVGLASKILPHNFNELIDASIKHLQGKPFEIVPDFPTGGLADFSRYNDGLRGGAVKIRARINQADNKTLVITEIPFGKTTSSIIESIVKENEKGKIKIKKIDDNTAENVEIVIQLAPGVSADNTIDALYAITECEMSISPNCCVIEDDKPKFIGVSELLKISVNNTVDLLTRELEIRKSELREDWHMSSLEKIFIEKRIYRQIEDCETWESVIQTINIGLQPYKKLFKRTISEEDIIKLTEIKIKRISKFDVKKADELIKGIEAEMNEVQNDLDNIISYTINYYRQIKTKYGKGRERKTEIRNFDTIIATKVVVANEKLYVDRKEGFIGTGMRKDDYVCDCSDIDDILVIRSDGSYLITKVSEKQFVGKDILHVSVFKKNERHTIYNIIYRDGPKGNIMMKRCAITGLTRDKDYSLTKGTEGSKILYLSANPNGEAEIVYIKLLPRPRLRNLDIELDFSTLAIKGKNSIGNILTKYPIHKIKLREKGQSTLGGRKIWFDHDVLRLNYDEKGIFLGEFSDDDKILVINKSGLYKLYTYDLSNHFENNIVVIEKFNHEKIYTLIYFDAGQKYHYLKRFTFKDPQRDGTLAGEHPNSKIILLTEEEHPRFEIKYNPNSTKKEKEIIDAEEFINIKNHKAKGKRLSNYKIKDIVQLEPVIKALESEEETIEIPETVDAGEFINIKEHKVKVKRLSNSKSKEIVQLDPLIKEVEPEAETIKIPEIADSGEFINIKKRKAKGKRLSNYKSKDIVQLEPLIKKVEPEKETIEISEIIAEKKPKIVPGGKERQMKLEF